MTAADYQLHDFQNISIDRQGGSESIAVLIPTIGESTLEEVVSRTRQELPDAEITIIGFGPLVEIARKHATRFLEFTQKTWKSIGINRAVEISDKNWFIVLDADAIPEPGWGQAMIREFTNNIRFFTGSVDLNSGNYWMRVYNLSLLHEFSSGKPASYRKHIPAISMGFTREFFIKNGHLLETINRSEDYEWSLRAYKNGISAHYTPEAVVSHLPVNKSTFRDVWKYWVLSGPDNISIRKQYQEILNTPKLLDHPVLVLLTSPILSLVPTFRILATSPKDFLRNLDLLPGIYITKIAWCVGVFLEARKTNESIGVKPSKNE